MARPAVIRALAGIVLLSLLLPWPGEADLWVRLALAVLALNALLWAHHGLAAGAIGCAMLLLTSLALRDGVEWGACVALAAEAGLIGVGVLSAIAARRHPA
jgi:hypothetical protein